MNNIKDYEDFSDSTKYLIINSDIYANLYDYFKDFINEKNISIIADENTMEAAGIQFKKFCENHNILIDLEYIFKAHPELTSNYENVQIIKNQVMNNDSIIVAIGSGTINDLVKRASGELCRKYAILATAASVDGYASDGAAILFNGLKQTLPCAAPAFIAADTNVLINAPGEMASSGYADLLAKNPAGADWILADQLDLDPIDKKVWNVIQGNLLRWTSHPERLKEKDDKAFKDLFTGLNVAGFAMQFMKRSRPVSGAEHLMSHIWEMEGHTFNGHHVSHGFKVAIGSLASIALMESVFNIDNSQFDIQQVLNNWPTLENRLYQVQKCFSHTNALDDLIKINKEKYISKEVLEYRLKSLLKNWPLLQKKITKQLIPYTVYRSLLSKASCPVKPEEIGLSIEKVLDTYIPAQMMRNRYTILDLAFETGLLKSSIEKIKNSNIYLK